MTLSPHAAKYENRAYSARPRNRVRRRSRAGSGARCCRHSIGNATPAGSPPSGKEVEASIETLRNYIDWTPFFAELVAGKGKYPRILEDEVVGTLRRSVCFKDANDQRG